jgi:hypothetical protein
MIEPMFPSITKCPIIALVSTAGKVVFGSGMVERSGSVILLAHLVEMKQSGTVLQKRIFPPDSSNRFQKNPSNPLARVSFRQLTLTHFSYILPSIVPPP